MSSVPEPNGSADEVAGHRLTLQVVEPFPEVVPAGAAVTARVRAQCERGCPVPGVAIDITADGGPVPFVVRSDESGDMIIETAAPRRADSFIWGVVARCGEAGDGIHEESDAVSMPLRTVPHGTSMAAWDVRTPIPAGMSSQVKVGVHCAVGCNLVGRFVQVLDDHGALVGETRLGGVPFPGTAALYWGAFDLASPEVEGVASYRAVFASEDGELPHEPSTAAFSFGVTGRPQHTVTIVVIDQATGEGVGDVEIRCGPYTESTDPAGRLRLEVSSGLYELTIRKDGWSAPATTIHVESDTSARIDAVVVPTMEEQAPHLTSFEGFPWG